jgi:hypothetical protein
MKTAENTIVAFHIGRGGHFYNQGHKTFLGEREIGEFTEDLFLNYENETRLWEEHGKEDEIFDLVYNEDFEALAAKYDIYPQDLGEKVYFDGSGNPVGLTKKEVDSGIGRIDIDGDYDTTYTQYLSDCDEREIEIIKKSDHWNKEEFLELLGIKEETED